MQASDIIKKLTNELSDNPSIKALLLVGSQARNTIYRASQHSDIEAYIVVEDCDVEDIEKELFHTVKRIGRVIFSYKNRWAGFSTVFEDLSRLELPIAKLSQLEFIFSRPKAQEIEVLLDKTDGILKTILDKRTDSIDLEKIFQYQVTDFWYMAIVGVQYYKTGELWHSRSALQILQSSLIKLFELYNDPNILLLETNKRIEEFLTHEQINMLKEVSPAYDNNEIVHAFEKIIDTFPRISRQVKGKYGYYYDEKIEKQISAQLVNLLKS
jgi:hypothetical protein